MSILALTSNTLTSPAAAGQIEYNGQFFGTDSNAARAQMQRITQGALVSASGTSVDFTGLPAWIKRITVMFGGLSTNGTSGIIVQIGSTTFTTSGYQSQVGSITGSNTVGSASATAGFYAAPLAAAADTNSGTLVLTNISGNTWCAVSNSNRTNNLAASMSSATPLALGGVLDRVRITTINGTDTFDAGVINILYEG